MYRCAISTGADAWGRVDGQRVLWKRMRPRGSTGGYVLTFNLLEILIIVYEDLESPQVLAYNLDKGRDLPFEICTAKNRIKTGIFEGRDHHLRDLRHLHPRELHRDGPD